ncbi:SNF1-related protein kinase regulatory subunit gamma-1-like [Impatiens glandulifera]|uniref:SNF1-related protein kinase regulatory subunit gamma-1-like n=1 Tax=Impatiens glandulifera TaxID=253017 RepID=UPI001FB11AEE|nr:SNF1-related protein kinase regulatory subunit gamma-1-like [Impatiens glandulifera]
MVEDSPRNGMSSPEAKLGMKVEDLWDVQEPELSSTDKLNACFESIPVSAFPQAPSSQVVEINSDATLAEAVQLLSQHKLLSAPVVNAEAPDDASWIDSYMGMVEFAGIVVWILHQSERDDNESPKSDSNFFDGFSEAAARPAVAAAASEMSSPRKLGCLSPRSAAITSGNFFQALTSSEFYRNTKVRDISGSFRWAPFLALQTSNSFLTMLLLLSKYRMKSIPVVDLGERKIDNIITQSAVIHMLEECAGLHWFESWCTKQLSELGLPVMKPFDMVKVNEDEPVLQAFKLMRQKGVGAVPIVETGGRKTVGNISIRDIQFLLVAPEIYMDYKCITAKNFLTAVRRYKEDHGESPLVNDMVTCKKEDTLKEVISTLDCKKIHRIYVVDDDGNLEGVVTLRDIISKLVHEPRGYFGDFFDGVLPLPADSRV